MAGGYWRAVIGYEGIYEVSDLGEVRVLPRTVISGSGRVEHRPAKMLKPFTDRHGYKYVDLAQVGAGRHGKARRGVHHLVLEAFVAPMPLGMECDHINSEPSDNRVSNLRWVAKAVNLARRRFRRGSQCSWTKLTPEDVLDIKRRCANGDDRQGIADEFGISKSHVSSIYCGRRRAVEV